MSAEKITEALKGVAVEAENAASTTADQAVFQKTAEYSNYFCEYAKLYHQKDMLEDGPRMRAYYSAIMGNASCFKDKVVLDMGSGTGVLAMWAAKAGAKKVYAVEATPMARHARTLVKANGLDHIVEVIQSKMEDVELPCKVDVIVSEWMGYLLVRESMLDSVIVARDKFLKPGGALYPSHARIQWGAVQGEYGYGKNKEGFRAARAEWMHFTHEINAEFQLDLSALTKEYDEENQEYFLGQAYYRNMQSEQILGEHTNTTEIDLNTVSIAELREIDEKFTIDVRVPGEMTALGCWFVTEFNGGPDCPAPNPIVLDTSPHGGETHWGQQVLQLPEAVAVRAGDRIDVTSVIRRHKDNDRMVHCTMGATVFGKDSPSTMTGQPGPKDRVYAPKLYHIQ